MTELNSSNISICMPETPNCTALWDYYEFGHGLSQFFYVTMATVFILIIVTSIFWNILLITIIVISKKLHSISHVFIVNLAVGDLITTLFVIPFDVNFMLTGIFTRNVVLCATMQATFLMSIPLAVFNLFLLTFERFVTISFPFKREQIFTSRSIISVLLAIWCYTIGVSLYPMLSEPGSLYCENGFCELDIPTTFSIYHGAVNFLIPIFGIIVLNLLIFRIAKLHEQKIEKTLTDAKKQQCKILSFRKATKRISLLVGVCVFCSLFYIALVIWNISCAICHPREVTWIGNAVNYLSVSVNPILYGALNVTVRKELMKQGRNFFGKTPQKTSLIEMQTIEANVKSGLSSRRSSDVKL